MGIHQKVVSSQLGFLRKVAVSFNMRHLLNPLLAMSHSVPTTTFCGIRNSIAPTLQGRALKLRGFQPLVALCGWHLARPVIGPSPVWFQMLALPHDEEHLS